MDKITSILMIAQRFKPATGGVEKHVEEVGRLLVSKSYSVTILSAMHKPNLKRVERIGPLRVIRMPFGWDRNPPLLCLWVLRNRKRFMDYDFVHVHDTVPLLFWYLPLIFIHRKVPVFATFHGYERDPVPIMFKVLRKIAEILVKGSICIGHFIPKIYGTNCNVVLTGAVDSPSLKKMSRSGAIFVGRLEQDTGLMEYIRALHILKDAHGITLPFTICGAGAFEAEAMRLAESLGIDVKFKGVIPEPWKLINSKQVCFAAGYLTILEAMSLGLPVIGIARSPLKVAYLKGVLKDGGPISIQTTPEGVAREIARVINDPQLAARISRRGKQFASKMSWGRMTKAYLDLWTGVSQTPEV